jgi:hypothetical protein
VSTDTVTVPTGAGPSGAPGAPAPPSTGVRRFWKVGGSVLAVFLLPFGVMQVVTELAHEEHTEHHAFPAGGIRVIEVRSGSDSAVRIVGGEGAGESGDEIRVTAHVSEGLRSTGHRERVVGDRLVLESSCPIFFSSFCAVDYTVETPSDVDVLVRSDRGATIEGIDGDVDVTSDQGSIDLAGLRGSVRAHADQGSVRASPLRSTDVEASSDQGDVFLRFLDEPRRVVAESDQGDVEVVVPGGDAFYALTTDTDQGKVRRDIRADPSSDRSISATTDQGDVILRYP